MLYKYYLMILLMCTTNMVSAMDNATGESLSQQFLAAISDNDIPTAQLIADEIKHNKLYENPYCGILLLNHMVELESITGIRLLLDAGVSPTVESPSMELPKDIVINKYITAFKNEHKASRSIIAKCGNLIFTSMDIPIDTVFSAHNEETCGVSQNILLQSFKDDLHTL